MKQLNKKKILYVSLISYGVVFGIILFVYFFIGIFPFGNKTILKIDLYHVYAPIINQLREGIIEGKSLLYSWYGGLGENILGQFIYLAISPFNIIALLFPEKLITESMALLILIKIPFAASSSAYFLNYKFSYCKKITILFSIMYALSSYIVAFYWNVMWIDAIIFLPIIAKSIEEMVKNNKRHLYCFILAITIISNFYIAVYVCLFSVIYFLFLCINNNIFKLDKDIIIKKISIFLAYSLLSGGIAACVLFPIYNILQLSSYTDGTLPQNITWFFSIWEFFANHFALMKGTDIQGVEVVPNIYIGVLPIILLPIFFINKSISKKEKIEYILVLICCFLFFEINVLSYIIHGFHYPAGLPHRFSFLYSFFVLLMAATSLKDIDKIKKRTILKVFFFEFIGFLIICFCSEISTNWKPGHFTKTSIIWNSCLLLYYFITFYFFIIKKKQYIKYMLLVGVIFEIFVGTKSNMQVNSGSSGNLPERNNYIKYLDNMNEINTKLGDSNNFYKSAFRRLGTANDAKLYHYNGMSMFVSPVYSEVVNLYRNLGITASYNAAKYIDPTPIVNSILSVKYLFSKETEVKNEFWNYKFKQGDIYVYENPYSLPLGYIVSEKILNWDLDKLINPFHTQNEFVSMALERNYHIFNDIEWEGITYENILIEKSNKENTVNFEVINPYQLEDIPSITYKIFAPEEKYLYLSYYAPVSGIELSINGKKTYTLGVGRSTNGTFDVGLVGKGDKIEITLKFGNKDLNDSQKYISNGSSQVFLAQLNKENYSKAIEELNNINNAFYITNYNETNIQGNVTVDNKGVLYFSIPYDKNWKATINGNEVNTIKIGNALTGILLEKGHYEVSLVYKQKGLILGIIISMISISIFLISWVYSKKKE